MELLERELDYLYYNCPVRDYIEDKDFGLDHWMTKLAITSAKKYAHLPAGAVQAAKDAHLRATHRTDAEIKAAANKSYDDMVARETAEMMGISVEDYKVQQKQEKINYKKGVILSDIQNMSDMLWGTVKTIGNYGGFKATKAGTLYLIKIGENTLGYGISNNFENRLSQHKRTFAKAGVEFEVLHTVDFKRGKKALQLEKLISANFEQDDCMLDGFKTESTPMYNLDDVYTLISEAA